MNNEFSSNNDTKMTVVNAKGLCKRFGSKSAGIVILDDAELSVKDGEILAILGASGSGKSTLLHLLGLLDSPDAGSICINGDDMTPLSGRKLAQIRNQTLGFVFQFYHLLRELTALENVVLPQMMQHGFFSWKNAKAKAYAQAKKLLEEVGLSARIKHKPDALSGGERQRVAIARALMNSPDILCCDEPTGNLDYSNALAIKELLWDLNRQKGMTMIIVTHDMSMALAADRALMLQEGVLRQLSREEMESGVTARTSLDGNDI